MPYVSYLPWCKELSNLGQCTFSIKCNNTIWFSTDSGDVDEWSPPLSESRHISPWTLLITITLTEHALLIFLQSRVEKLLAWPEVWIHDFRSRFRRVSTSNYLSSNLKQTLNQVEESLWLADFITMQMENWKAVTTKPTWPHRCTSIRMDWNCPG